MAPMDPSEAEWHEVEETSAEQGDGDDVGACPDRRYAEPVHKRSCQTLSGYRVKRPVSSW